MSVTAIQSKAIRQGNGTTTSFSFPFKVWDASQVAVFLSSSTGDVDVTASVGIDVLETGGNVHFQTAPDAGQIVAILRRMPFTQEDEYAIGARFEPAVLEERLDRDCAERQQLLEAVERAVKMPATAEMTPEEYERQYFQSIEDKRATILSEMCGLRDETASARDAAGAASQSAGASLEEVKTILVSQIMPAVRRAENSATSARDFAIKIEEAIEEAAETAAACIIGKLEGAAHIALFNAGAAAQSACAATATAEKTWLMVRSMTQKAAEEAAACVLEQCDANAEIACDCAETSAANAKICATYADTISTWISENARQSAQAARDEIADCVENVCVGASEISMANAGAAAASAKTAAEIADGMEKTIAEYAQNAAMEAANQLAEINCGCVKIALGHAQAAAASAKEAQAFAEMARQTDICVEAETRRAKDKEIEARLVVLEGRNSDIEDLLTRLAWLESHAALALEDWEVE